MPTVLTNEQILALPTCLCGDRPAAHSTQAQLNVHVFVMWTQCTRCLCRGYEPAVVGQAYNAS